MIDKEKQIKSKYYYRICAIFFSLIIAISYAVPISTYAYNAFKFYQTYADMQEDISNINPDDDFIYFYSKNIASDGMAYVAYFYACLEGVEVTVSSDTIEFNSVNGFYVYNPMIYAYRFPSDDWYMYRDFTNDDFFKCYKLIYSKVTENFLFYTKSSGTSPIQPYVKENYTKSDGTFYSVDNFYTNIEEFKEPEKMIEVTFTPELSGTIDRSFTKEGQLYYSKTIDMQVKNVSKTNIQYKIGIFPSNVTEWDDQKAIFIYFRPDTVYSSDLTNEQNFKLELPNLMSKNTYLHWLAPRESNYQTFNYSQLPLEQNTEYRVLAYAIETPYLYGSEMLVSDYEEVYEDLFQLNAGNFKKEFDSVFKIKYLADVPYDYNDDSNGVVPYKSIDDFHDNIYSYWASTDENGQLQAGGNNRWSGNNNWVKYPSSSGSGIPSRVQNKNDTETIVAHADGFSYLIKSFMALFPPEIQALFTFTCVAVVFVIILKFVRG